MRVINAGWEMAGEDFGDDFCRKEASLRRGNGFLGVWQHCSAEAKNYAFWRTILGSSSISTSPASSLAPIRGRTRRPSPKLE